MTLIGKAEACRARGNGAERGNTRLMGPKGLEGGAGGQVLECESSGSGQTPRRTGKEGRPAGPGSPPPPKDLSSDCKTGHCCRLRVGKPPGPGLPWSPQAPLPAAQGGDGAGTEGGPVGVADSFHSRRYNPGRRGDCTPEIRRWNVQPQEDSSSISPLSSPAFPPPPPANRSL